MTTPGGVPNLPPGALTLDTLASDTQDVSQPAMKARAAGRFSSIFSSSTGLSPASEITPFGILTSIFAGFNSTVANADPADVDGPEDLPGLLLDFIESLPFVGQFVGLFEAILGEYDGDDETLLGIQTLFAPIRALVDAVTGATGGIDGLGTLMNVFPDLLGAFDGIDFTNPGAILDAIADALVDVPILGDIVAAITGSTGDLTDLTGWFTDLLGIFGNPTGLGTGTPGLGDLSSIPILGPIIEGLVNGGQNVNVLNLFGSLPENLFGNVFASSLVTGSPNLLNNGGFDGSISMDGDGIWLWDAAVGHTTTGSASTVANSSLKALLSNAVSVAEGQKLTPTTWVKTSSYTGTGTPIRLAVRTYLHGAAVSTTNIQSVAGPGGTWTQLTGTYTVPAGVDSVRLRLVVDTTATGGTVWFDDATLSKPGNGPFDGILQLFNLTSLDDLFDGLDVTDIWKSIISVILNPLSILNPGLMEPSLIGGVAGSLNIGADLKAVIDAAWSGLTKTSGSNKSTAELTNAATDIVNTTEAAQASGDENSAILAIRDNKALYEGVNETEESTFLLDTLVGATDPPNFGVTSSTSTIGFWRAGQAAHKGFITYFGKGITSITGIFIDLYKMNDVSGTLKLQLVKSSTDLSGQATSSWKNIIWVMDAIDRPDVVPGEVYAFSVRVTGAGTHSVAGKAAAWMPDHALAASGTIPSRPAAVRTAGTSDINMSSITYSGNQPWFGFGIVTGDIAPAPLIPRPTTYSAAGTYHYDLLALRSAGFNYVDVIGVGSGGGGCGGFAAFQYGAGGGAGTWGDATVDIAAAITAGATEITVVVPSGGTAGAAFVAAGSGAYGGAGAATTFTVTGIGTLTCAGGAAGIGGAASAGPPPQYGASPGDHLFNGINYSGGGQQNSNHGAGNGPGGGGAGDGGGFYFGNGGGVGGRGGAFLRAYQ